MQGLGHALRLSIPNACGHEKNLCGRTTACHAQVSYCQGMAFVAGVVLMYLPEEPAFQVPTEPGGRRVKKKRDFQSFPCQEAAVCVRNLVACLWCDHISGERSRE